MQICYKKNSVNEVKNCTDTADIWCHLLVTAVVTCTYITLAVYLYFEVQHTKKLQLKNVKY